MHANFLAKIPKNCYVFLDILLAVLWYFHFFFTWIKIGVLIISLDSNILCIFDKCPA